MLSKILAALLAAAICLAVLPASGASADEGYPLNLSAPTLVSASSGIRPVRVGDGNMFIITNAKNSSGEPVSAVFVVQVTDRHGFTESISLQNATLAAGAEVNVGAAWMPQSAGVSLVDVFAVDSINSPHTLSAKSGQLFDVTEGTTVIAIKGRYEPAGVTVVIGYNNTVTWVNEDSRPRYVRADNINDSGFADAVRHRGKLEPGGSFSYTFREPGVFGFHEDTMRGTVTVLPDPYEGYESMEDERDTSVELEMYGDVDPDLSGHFLKGHVLDSVGRPIAHGNVDIAVNGVYMGNATTNIDGCFEFNRWQPRLLSGQKEAAIKEGYKFSLDLQVIARYTGDGSHFWSQSSASSQWYFRYPPMPPAQYEMSVSGGNYTRIGDTVSVVQGGESDMIVQVRSYLPQYDLDKMSFSISRLPCAVSADVSKGSSEVTTEKAGQFEITLSAQDYTTPGKYVIYIEQDLSKNRNPYVTQRQLDRFWLEILPSQK